MSNSADRSQAKPPAQSLGARIRLGGTLSVAGFGASQAIRLASNLIMARLLAPEAFGVLAIAISLQILMIMISDLGINQSVIRSKAAAEPAFLSTAWVTQIARGLVLAIFLLLSAWLVNSLAGGGFFHDNSVFNDPRLPAFIIATAGITMLDGVRSLKLVLCQRDLKLGRVIILEIVSQIFGLGMMLWAFSLGAGPYSLIVNMVSSVTLSVIGTYVFLPGPTIKLAFDRRHFSEIFHYGKWILLASFFGFLIQRGDQFIFATILDSPQFGLYAIATIWITVAILLVDNILSRIAYPSFAEVWRETPADLTHIYTKFRLALDGLCLLIFIAIMGFGETFFRILYPENYGGVAVYLHLLGVLILFLPYRLLNTVILAEGRSRDFLTVTIGPTLMMMIGTPLVYAMSDIRTAIIFSALAYIPSIPLSWFYTRRFLKLSPLRELPMAIIALVAAIIITLS